MMFLTRLGDDSRMIITATSRRSTCRATRPPALCRPRGAAQHPGIEFHHFTATSRAPSVVQKIIAALQQARSAVPLGRTRDAHSFNPQRHPRLKLRPPRVAAAVAVSTPTREIPGGSRRELSSVFLTDRRWRRSRDFMGRPDGDRRHHL